MCGNTPVCVSQPNKAMGKASRRPQPNKTMGKASRRPQRRLFVTLRHPEMDIAVPETILRACSPVLDGILRDMSPPDDGGNKVLSIDDVKLSTLQLFVDMLTASSSAPTRISLLAIAAPVGFRSPFLASVACQLMPLIHKYDCKGLVMQLQKAVHESLRNPHSQLFFQHIGLTIKRFYHVLGRSIATMLAYDTEDSSKWMTASTMNCLAAYCISSNYAKDE